MKKFNTILLFGGETKNENMPMGFYSSLPVLMLKGKPIIWWQLDNLKKLNIEDIILVIGEDNSKLIDYVNEVLMCTFKIKIVYVQKNQSIINSLKCGLDNCDVNIPTRVILGDTLITESINDEENVLYTSKVFSISKNWCLAKKSGDKLRFYDKLTDVDLTNKEVLVGYYSFSDTKYLIECCQSGLLNEKQEISTVLVNYQKNIPLKSRLIEDWYDLGHTAGLIKAKNILYNSRNFNHISVNTELGVLVKTSTQIQKLKDEVYWYKNIPEELKILTPRLVSFEKSGNSAKLVQELYGYSTLQELYLSRTVNIEDWKCILELLFNLHKHFEKYTIKANLSDFNWLYWGKTNERLLLLKEQNPFWAETTANRIEIINGKKYMGLPVLLPLIKDYISTMILPLNWSIIHGDYCFSNILFDSMNYIFKLIDPRGSIRGHSTIYGDTRYDIAKLRHSVCGMYDFIVQNLFWLKKDGKNWTYKIFFVDEYKLLEPIFDDISIKNGFNPNELKFIEGLLFLSMLPLHEDNIEAQKIFYLKALELLNDVLLRGK